MTDDLFDFDRPARYAVMGNPVSHSKSPAIHQQFARQFGIRLEYTAIQVDPGGFPQAVDQFRANGGKGLNITVPFKLEAFRLADHKSHRAELAGAVNTLKFEADGQIFGDNTDGAGLAHDLTHNLHLHLKDKRILLLGAGGAARGVIAPLLKLRPAALVIANRTAGKARELAAEFAEHGKIEGCGFDALGGKRFDLVINATAASLKGELPPLPAHLFTASGAAYDMMYGERTPFMDWADFHGASLVTDGLGMLVEQAAESFLIWHGKRPDTRAVIAGLKKQA